MPSQPQPLARDARRRQARSPLALVLARLHVLIRLRSAARRRPGLAVEYAFKGRETDNFTYELENEAELRGFVISATAASAGRVRALFAELHEDRRLRDALSAELRTHPDRHPEPLYGSRVAFYCLTRLFLPATVVETGVHDGLGAAVILRALERNAEEGHPGTLHGFDIDHDAGWLIPAGLLKRYVPHEGDLEETLAPALGGLEVGLSIHDVGNRDGDLMEHATVVRHAADRLVIVSAGAADSGALRELCDSIGARYRSVEEQPRHFSPGRTIALAVVDRAEIP